jgi:hypothetical protein
MLMKEKFLSVSNKYEFVNMNKQLLALMILIMLIFIFGCSRQPVIDEKAYASCVEEFTGYDAFEKGGISIYFQENATSEEINTILKSIGSEQSMPSILTTNIWINPNPKFGTENEAKEIAEQIKSKFNVVESYDVAKTYPDWTGYSIQLVFVEPLNEKYYAQLIQQIIVDYPQLTEINPVEETSENFYWDKLLLQVPVGREIEFMCKLKAINSPTVEDVYLWWIPVPD